MYVLVYINRLKNLKTDKLKKLSVRIVQDNQSRNDTGNPTTESQNQDYQHGTASLVDDREGWKDNGENNSEYRHVQCV